MQERHDDALRVASRAARVFEAFGDRQRLASAKVAIANAHIFQLQYRDALPLLQDIEAEFRAEVDSDTRARVLGNIALCQIELQLISEGLTNYQVAAAIFEELGNVSEAARIRYHVAGLLAANGKHAEAKNRLRSVRNDFQKIGMLHLAVSAGLDLSEILISEKSFAEAEQLCIEAIRQFERTGLGTTTQGLTALSFLKEAAAERRATPQVARHVRTYIERLPNEPQLLFAPPPL